MHSAESILVIIVSAVLSLFLIIAIVVLLLVARMVRSLHRLIRHAERVMATAGDAAEMLKNASGPLALFKVVRNIMHAVDKHRA